MGVGTVQESYIIYIKKKTTTGVESPFNPYYVFQIRPGLRIVYFCVLSLRMRVRMVDG